MAGDVTIPPAFIGAHFKFICHLWVAEFEDVDVENIDILVGYQLFIADFVIDLFFPENKICFDDVTSALLIWMYAYALRVLMPQPPSLVLTFDLTLFHSLSLGLSPPTVKNIRLGALVTLRDKMLRSD